MFLSRLLGFTTALAFVSACGDAPTTPDPVESLPVPDASASAVAADHPTGEPAVDRVETSFSATVPCMTFDMRIESIGSDVTQAWFYPNGNLRLFTLHRRQTNTFTNLSSGFTLTQEPSLNETTDFDENGLPISTVINGAAQKIRTDDSGKKLYYHIGHWTFTFDFNVSPPAIEQTFDGRSNLDIQQGPCVALGDPATP